ncbi:MAG TPA: NUDIX hydrolase [Terriglobia bacterium]|nr:NUDIX hydrolase [Terriglobia bacterium]
MIKAKQHGTARRLYEGPVFSVWRHRVVEPGGMSIVRDLVHHPGSAVILPRTVEGRIVLVRQYRLAAGRELWELPAGTVDNGETPLQTARRELAEETGYRSSRWRKLIAFYPSPGLIAERMTLFLAEDVQPGVPRLEADERIAVQLFSVPQLLRMVRAGDIVDAKTLTGLLYWELWEASRTPRK